MKSHFKLHSTITHEFEPFFMGILSFRVFPFVKLFIPLAIFYFEVSRLFLLIFRSSLYFLHTSPLNIVSVPILSFVYNFFYDALHWTNFVLDIIKLKFFCLWFVFWGFCLRSLSPILCHKVTLLFYVLLTL